MKGRWILAIIGANLVALVGLAFAYPHLMVSPGAVIPAHAALATDCFACHAPLRGASTQRCVACHALPDIGLRTTQGLPLPKPTVKASFHQQLIAQDCMACHSDHQGPKLTLRSHKPFSHVLLQPNVRERCASCHAAPKNDIHRDLTVSCSQCHRSEAWKPATFAHDKLFLLDKDHNASCVTCHTQNDYSKYTCFGCHEHTLSNVRAKHEKEGIRNFDNCVRCHRSADGEAGEQQERGKERD
jgi:Class III cytochrome C family